MSEKIRTVLVAEDSDDDYFLFSRTFRKGNGPALKRSRDGAEAIDYLAGDEEYADRAEHPLPELVVLDLKLPKKSGFDVLRWVRQHPHLTHIPVVVLSSSAEPRDINLAYTLGANSFLTKPGNYDLFVEMIDRIKEYWVRWNEPPPVPIE